MNFKYKFKNVLFILNKKMNIKISKNINLIHLVIMLSCIQFINSKFNINLGGFIRVDLSVSPLIVNAFGKYTFILYPNSKILNTDQILVIFPQEVIVTDGNLNCQAVILFLIISHLQMIQHCKLVHAALNQTLLLQQFPQVKALQQI